MAKHFRNLCGKIYRTAEGILYLALRKKEEQENGRTLDGILEDAAVENILLIEIDKEQSAKE